MLSEVADGVWVRQSEWVWSNAVVVRADDGLVIVDPGISGADLDDLADDVARLGLPVVAGFATHPHFDHLLWHPRLGEVPRYASPACARLAAQAGDRAREMAAQTAPGIPLELVAVVTPLPSDGGPIPGRLIVHDAHAVGHTAILLDDVLIAGDMLSDVLVPLLDPRQTGQVTAYREAFELLDVGARVVIPGHGSVARGEDVAARLAADRTYVEALAGGVEPGDARLREHDWLDAPHRANQRLARA